MKITKTKLKEIIREEIAHLAETLPTSNLESGDTVKHKDEPELGVGVVTAKGRGADKTILVKWKDVNRPKSHIPSVLTLVKKKRLEEILKEGGMGNPDYDQGNRDTTVSNLLRNIVYWVHADAVGGDMGSAEDIMSGLLSGYDLEELKQALLRELTTYVNEVQGLKDSE